MTSKNFTSYALLGSGRIAWHFRFYFKSLNLPVCIWSRNGDPAFNSFSDPSAKTRLDKTVANSSHILFAVSDDAIEELAALCPEAGKTLVHFSGAANISAISSAHPLMTFGPQLGELDWYRKIPFVLSQERDLAALLPGLKNPSWHLAGGQRALYHALCSLAGNSTYLLWRNIGDEFERTLHLPRQLLTPFLHQVVNNASAGGAFTGPVARGDWQTVGKHLEALDESQRPILLKAYHDFLNLAGQSGHVIPQEIL